MGDHTPSGALTAVLEHLMQSGLAVTAHGEAMAQSHARADAAVDSAAAGWRGRSAAALLARSQEWSATTGALLSRLGAHAEGLHTCSQTFAHMAAEHEQALRVVHPQGM